MNRFPPPNFEKGEVNINEQFNSNSNHSIIVCSQNNSNINNEISDGYDNDAPQIRATNLDADSAFIEEEIPYNVQSNQTNPNINTLEKESKNNLSVFQKNLTMDNKIEHNNPDLKKPKVVSQNSTSSKNLQ